MAGKGISSIVSVVLILAITLTVLGLFSSWAPSVVGGVLEGIENQTEHQIKCDKASIKILSAKYWADGNVTVVVRNTGTIDLEQLQLEAWEEDVPKTQKLVSVPRGDYNVTNISAGFEPTSVRASSRNCPNPTDSFEDIE